MEEAPRWLATSEGEIGGSRISRPRCIVWQAQHHGSNLDKAFPQHGDGCVHYAGDVAIYSKYHDSLFARKALSTLKLTEFFGSNCQRMERAFWDWSLATTS